jgi:hypothetical protein
LDCVTDCESQPCSEFHESKVSGDRRRYLIGECRMPQLPKTLGQLARVDIDWTCCGAQTVHGAGVQHHVREVAIQGIVRGMARAFILQSLQFAADHNALPRRQRQVAAGTFRFAIATFDALVDLVFHHRHLLEIFKVGFRIGIQNDTGIEQVVRIGEETSTIA